jgi:hypothetical protein
MAKLALSHLINQILPCKLPSYHINTAIEITLTATGIQCDQIIYKERKSALANVDPFIFTTIVVLDWRSKLGSPPSLAIALAVRSIFTQRCALE